MKPRSNSRSRRPDSGSTDRRREKKEFSSDNPRFRKKEDGEGSSEKSYERKSSSGDSYSRKPYEKKPFGKKPYGRPERDERKSGFRDTAKERGEAKPDYERKSYVRKSFDKKPYSRPSGDERKSFDRDSNKERGEGKSSFERKPYEKKQFGRKPYSRPDGDERRKPYRDKDSESGERKWNRKEKHEFYGERKKFDRSFSQKLSQKKSTYSDEPDKSSGDLIRLNKYISNAGICSRREADQLIETGAITVNGEIVSTLGYKVKPGDVVKYNTQTLRGEKNVYLLLNKPKDFITTVDDPQDRKTVMWLIKDKCKERIYPVGRLDRNTTGVLLFTNDGDLAKKLTHPSYEIEKIYQAELDKNLKPDDFEKLEKGVELEDGFIKPDVISFIGPEKSIVGIEIHSGRNKIVRRMFEHLGYDVIKLDRVVFAGLTKKDLPRGRSRFLTQLEVANLKMMTGKKKFERSV
jgi:23S rRNA pseudouridine2605 synthase